MGMFWLVTTYSTQSYQVAYYIVAEDDGANSASDPPNGPLTTYRYTVVCCTDRVGDANGTGEYPDEVTLGDIMLMVDILFISNDCTKLVDFLFITGPETAVLPDCL